MDVLVVGSGYAGLTAAALLARRGLEVELIERSRVCGGRARAIQRDGWIVDYGIHGHRLGQSGSAAQALNLAGECIEWIEETVHDSYIKFGDNRQQQFHGIGPFLLGEDYSTLQKLSVAGVFAHLLAIDPQRNSGRNVAHFLRWHSDEQVRGLMRFLCFGMIAPELERASLGELVDFVRRMIRTPVEQRLGTPVGGDAQLIGKLRGAIEHAGGKIKLSEPLKSLEIQNGRVTRALTGKRELEPRAVVFTPPLQQLHKYLPQGALDAQFVERASMIEPTAGVSIDFGLKHKVSDLCGTVIDLDLPSFGKFPSNSDPSLAPPDKQLATFLIVIPAQQIRSRQAVAEAEHRLREHIRSEFPGFFEAVEWERRLVVPILDGALLRPGQSRWDRPGLRAPGVDNLFFAGDTTCGDGCSGDIAFDSAIRADKIAAEFLRSC
ncbi:MAG: FAD-dependent oxidoreductase [Candidatus Alcyoniella australis]|nr:FAD-dependent oxidoreductase [Candidatus Alcyoniella australis]